MLSLGYRYVYAIVMSIAGLALCLRVYENAALEYFLSDLPFNKNGR